MLDQARNTLEQAPFRRLPWKLLVVLPVSLLFTGWLLSTPEGLLGKADAIGYAVCHRIDLRSFHLGDRQLPLCARCSGMYLAALVGIAYQGIRSGRRSGLPPKKLWVLLGLLGITFGVDGLNSYLHLFPIVPGLYQPNNFFRLVTGSGMGVVIAAAIFPVFNQTVWKVLDSRPSIPDGRSLTGLLALVFVLDLLLLSGNPLVLYPLALVSAAGVLVLLALIYTIVCLALLKAEARFTSFTSMTFPLIGGLGLALLQIAVIDFLRYLVTGTWDGFHLG